MKLNPVVPVVCDGCGTLALFLTETYSTYNKYDGGVEFAIDVDDLAMKKAGWRNKDGRNLCPDCVRGEQQRKAMERKGKEGEGKQ